MVVGSFPFDEEEWIRRKQQEEAQGKVYGSRPTIPFTIPKQIFGIETSRLLLPLAFFLLFAIFGKRRR